MEVHHTRLNEERETGTCLEETLEEKQEAWGSGVVVVALEPRAKCVIIWADNEADGQGRSVYDLC